ncbi:DUF3221 domain-containing protein [Pontibacter oryzae]|uniref:DUF3221 domain-containing protein n=2 Tax=Pontibacter oryzae TaxID=2304593 RepID=A0A399SK39_9BACT|nr:DUF3221 domain-containing protein [Pontibacter oryzae]
MNVKKITPLYFLITVLSATFLFACSKEPKRIPDTMPDVHGYITNIKRAATNDEAVKAEVAVKALDGVEAQFKDANIKIDEHTLIEDETGKMLTLKNLREGHEVQVWFDGEVMESDPVQAYAKAVRIKY